MIINHWRFSTSLSSTCSLMKLKKITLHGPLVPWLLEACHHRTTLSEMMENVSSKRLNAIQFCSLASQKPVINSLPPVSLVLRLWALSGDLCCFHYFRSESQVFCHFYANYFYWIYVTHWWFCTVVTEVRKNLKMGKFFHGGTFGGTTWKQKHYYTCLH